MSQLVSLAEASQIVIRHPDHVQLQEIDAEDGVLLINPGPGLPAAELVERIEGGLRVALADDYGQGTRLLRVFSIRRHGLVSSSYISVGGNSNLALAIPEHPHPLREGVSGVVTNHPRALRHASLIPVFGFGEQAGAFVLAGSVGDGRFVGMSDPSALINNMLAFRGNRRFAENLLAYLSRGGSGTIWLIGPRATLVGEEDPSAGVEGFAAWLQRMAGGDPPEGVLQVFAVLFALLAMIFVAGILPRRSPYEAQSNGETQGSWHSMLERRYLPGAGAPHYFYPLMAYRRELLEAVAQHVGGAGRQHVPSICEAMRTAGVSKPVVSDFRALAEDLGELQRREDVPPRVGRSRFVRYVRRGEVLLNSLRCEADKDE